jgi:hypothetical protein
MSDIVSHTAHPTEPLTERVAKDVARFAARVRARYRSRRATRVLPVGVATHQDVAVGNATVQLAEEQLAAVRELETRDAPDHEFAHHVH